MPFPAAEVPPASREPDILDLSQLEAIAIAKSLRTTGGNRTKAAELLAISVRTLRNKLNGPGRGGGEEDE